MAKTIRIKTDVLAPSDKYINVKLDQDFQQLDILSLTLKQSDIYKSFNADYGVVIGRVLSSGVGLPNCKVSIFIPISATDSNNPLITSIYPFTVPTDKDNSGKRFNLLNKLKRLNPFTGFKENNYGFGYLPKTPVGSTPDKIELLTNGTWVEVYDTYYKYTTVTNASGDYCLYGVPVGQQTIHMDCDITDIGKYSTTIPILSQIGGIPSNLLNSDGTKINPTTDLSSIPTIQSINTSINVVPFWGDTTSGNYQIGITRHDFNISARIIPAFTVVGAGFTQGEHGFWGDRIIFNAVLGLKNLCISIGSCNLWATDISKSNSPVNFYFCSSLKLTFLKRTIVDITIGNTPSDGNCGTNTFNFNLCISIIIPNIIPFICVDALRFASCTINGGEFEQDPISIIWLGQTSVCGDCSAVQTQSTAGSDNFTTLMNLDDGRVGSISTNWYTYKPTTSDNDIINSNVDVTSDIQKMGSTQYSTINTVDGTFLYQLPCNRDYVITDEFGNEIPSPDNTTGLPTGFWGYGIFSLSGPDIKSSGGKVSVDRVKIKVPQNTDYNTDGWVSSAYYFQSNQVYSVSQFMLNAIPPDTSPNGNPYVSTYTGLLLDVNTLGKTDPTLYGQDMEMINNTTLTLFPSTNNVKVSPVFVNEWLNGSLFFPQVGYRRRIGKNNDYACTTLLGNPVRTRDDSNPLGGSDTNSRFILNGSNFQTNFIQLNKDDLSFILAPQTDVYRGVILNDATGTYMNTNNLGIKYYYQGLIDSANSITELINKDII